MKIAIVAPVDERVPPLKYGGTELFVYNLARRLAESGCEVVLLASGDSLGIEGVELVPCSKTATRLLPGTEDLNKRHEYWIEGARKAAVYLEAQDDIDIVINNNGWPFLNILEDFDVNSPIITVLHGTLTVPNERKQFIRHKDKAFISISKSQRDPMPILNYLATIPHGIDVGIFPYRQKHDGYFAWLGRFVSDKGPLEAMAISRITGRILKMGGKVDPMDKPFFDEQIAPQFDESIHHLGELDHSNKVKLLSGAEALIFPLQWSEPFGLVMIESLACGTPVVALRNGSVPEIIEDGVTGLICDSVEEIIQRIKTGALARIKRKDCRDAVTTRFSDRLMAGRYIKACTRFLAKHYAFSDKISP